MPNAATDRYSCLRRLNLTEEEALALERIWDTPAIRLIADDRAAFLANKGYGALDTLDAIWHGLDSVVADTYMQHGLTPHQGLLIHTSPRASLNMWGPDRDIDRVHSILGAPLPPDMIAGILLEANTPEEAQTLIGYYASTEHDDSPEYDAAMIRIFAMFDTANYSRVMGCDCLRPDERAKGK